MLLVGFVWSVEEDSRRCFLLVGRAGFSLGVLRVGWRGFNAKGEGGGTFDFDEFLDNGGVIMGDMILSWWLGVEVSMGD